MLAPVGRAFIKDHSYIASKNLLVLKANLRSIRVFFPIAQVLISDAFIGYLEWEILAYHLETAAIGKNSPVPVHEFMQASCFSNYLHSRRKEQVKSIAYQDLRSHFTQFIRRDRFHSGFCCNWHECRSVYDAVISQEFSGSCS